MKLKMISVNNKQRNKMKLKLLMLVMFVSGLIGSLSAQVMTPCLTMEQTQAKYNQDKANAIVVVNTSSQQLQTYYAQLACYWQQRDKDNQQKAKDAQQIAKDAQQVAKDLQQIETDKILADRATALNHCEGTYDELDAFIVVLLPWLHPYSEHAKQELNRIHANRHRAEGAPANPGASNSIHGFDNHAYIIQH